MKQLIVLVLLLVLVLCFSVESRRTTRRLRKCIEKSNVRCRYVRKCVQAKTKCVAHRTLTHCARWATRRVATNINKRVCLKIRGTRGAKKCLRCAKWGNKVIRRFTTKRVCARHVTKRSCTKHKNVCVRTATRKSCQKVEPKYRVRGPKKCRSGFQLTFKRTGKTIRRRCVRKTVAKKRVFTLRTCNSYLDPHTTGLNGQNFEFQVEGDFVMSETKDGVFAVHQRLKRFGGYTGTVGMAVRVNGVDILEYLGQNRFLLNGKPINVKNGVTMGLPNGGSVLRSGSTITVQSPNGAKAVYTEFGDKANLMVFIPSDLGTIGYCNGGKDVAFYMKNTAMGLFHDRMRVRFSPNAVPERHFSKQAKKNATERCKRQGLHGFRLKACIHDALILRNHPNQRHMIIRLIKNVKKLARRAKKITLKKAKRIIKNLNKRGRRNARKFRRHVRKFGKRARRVRRIRARRVRRARRALKIRRARRVRRIRRALKIRRARRVRRVRKIRRALKIRRARRVRKLRRRAIRRARRANKVRRVRRIRRVRKLRRRAVRRARRAQRRAARRAVRRAVVRRAAAGGRRRRPTWIRRVLRRL